MTGVERHKILPSTSDKTPLFGLQWHVTAKCQQKCLHCYMKDEPTYESEIKNELSFTDSLKVLDDFVETTKTWGAKGVIHFTGGDPLLKRGIFRLIEQANNRGLSVGLLGNPNLITDRVAGRLKDLGIARYQVSIDGMEATHDRLRGRKGLFQDTIRAIRTLNEAGIRSVVMFTLSRENSEELIEVIRLIAKEDVVAFDFARLVPVGSGAKLYDRMLTPHEYRNLLLRVLNEYQSLQENGATTRFGRKDHLWKLLYYELGLWGPKPSHNTDIIYDGCAIGSRTLSVLADGTVYACRRLPVAIGKVPEGKMRDIFIESTELNRMRKVTEMEKCSRCDLLNYCRGCPAVAYGATSNYYSADPQCWKEVNKE